MWNRAMESLERGVTTPEDESYIGELGVSGFNYVERLVVSNRVCDYQVIEGFSNAILVEIRVFHLSDPEFINKYNKQSEHIILGVSVHLRLILMSDFP